MKKVAIVFNQAPHGNSKGRESLDLALALSDINQISVFFINEGVLHLLGEQHPEQILMRNYIATFAMLELYDIDRIYVCQRSLTKYQLTEQPLILAAKPITQQMIAELFATYDSVLQL